jgi:hypothetical protein
MSVLDCFQRASAIPSKRDSLFEEAINRSPEEFDNLFDAKVRSHQGFSVTAPSPQTDPSPQAEK